MRRRRLALLAFALAPAALAAACFPDYEIAGSSAPPDADAGATKDGTTGPSDGNAPLPDGAPPVDGNAPPPDGTTPNDGGGSGIDAGTMVLVPKTPSPFAYRDPNDTTSTAASLTHDFYLDALELTAGVLRAWVAAGKPPPCTSPDGGRTSCTLDPGGPYAATIQWDTAWNTFITDDLYKNDINCHGLSEPFGASQLGTYNGTDDRLPANCINWYQAAALCWFEGQKRLPTQVEWQYEATGRGQSRTYVWGDTPAPADCSRAIWSNGDTQTYDGCNFPIAEGSAEAGASLDGVLDMAGSVHEWVWDWYDRSYPNSWGNDYAGLPGDAGVTLQKVARGGGWASGEPDLHTLHVYIVDVGAQDFPTAGYNDVGVRCARTKL